MPVKLSSTSTGSSHAQTTHIVLTELTQNMKTLIPTQDGH